MIFNLCNIQQQKFMATPQLWPARKKAAFEATVIVIAANPLNYRNSVE